MRRSPPRATGRPCRRRTVGAVMWLCTFLGRNGNKVYFFIEAPALVLCVWGWGGGRWGGWGDVGRDWRWDGAAVPQVLPGLWVSWCCSLLSPTPSVWVGPPDGRMWDFGGESGILHPMGIGGEEGEWTLQASVPPCVQGCAGGHAGGCALPPVLIPWHLAALSTRLEHPEIHRAVMDVNIPGAVDALRLAGMGFGMDAA